MILKMKMREVARKLIDDYKKRHFENDVTIREGFVIGEVVDRLEEVSDTTLQNYIGNLVREGASASSTVTLRADVFEKLEALQTRSAAFTKSANPLPMSYLIEVLLKIEADEAREAQEKKIEVLTWNTGLTERMFQPNFDASVAFISAFIEKTNGVAILQQIPCKEKVDGTWRKTELFLRFKEIFNEKEGYQTVYHADGNHGYVAMMTVAVTKRASVQQADASFYSIGIPTNREAGLCVYTSEKECIHVLGVHISAGAENAKQLNAINGKADIILGDFNAGNYLQSENRLVFNDILREHVCICNLPTKRTSDATSARETCIDHVFVKLADVTRCSTLVIHKDVKLSDHYPITFEVALS